MLLVVNLHAIQIAGSDLLSNCGALILALLSCCNRHLQVVIDSAMALQSFVEELFIVHGHVKCGLCIKRMYSRTWNVTVWDMLNVVKYYNR